MKSYIATEYFRAEAAKSVLVVRGAVLRYFARMDRDLILERLRAHEPELRRLGISRLSLFGSVARGEAGPDSDVDLAVTLDPRARITLFELGGLNVRIEDLLGAPVDVVTEPVRRPRFQRRIDQDRVDVF